MQKKLLWLLVLTAILACSDNPTQPSEATQIAIRIGGPAPLYLAADRAPGTLPSRYIVVVNEDVPDAVAFSRERARLHAFSVKVAWNTGLRFFAAELSAAAVEAIRMDPRVKYVEEDQKFELTDTYPNPPSWGLDRVDQASLPLNNTYQDYLGGNTPLATSHVYIIDSGIRYSHSEFEGRALPAFDKDSASQPRGSANFAVDCLGHGTHVAGTVGGRTTGVAKLVNLYGVRVFDCAGGTSQDGSDIISGVNWVTTRALRPAVANMSLRGPASQAMDDAVRASINAGITYVVTAGNDLGSNACNFSPARVSEAITVAATDANDSRSSFSNTGSCVDIFAPGRDIVSAGIAHDTELRPESGTSMAAPHVAGTAAKLLAWLYPDPFWSTSPATVWQTIWDYATYGVVSNAGSGSPNVLLNSAFLFSAVKLNGPMYINCGESGNFQMIMAEGVGPYINYEVTTFTGIPVSSDGRFTLQAAPSGVMRVKTLNYRAQDARGAVAENGTSVWICS